MQELINKERVRERLIQLLRQSPRSIRYYAQQIGIAPLTLRRLVTRTTSDFQTLQKVANFVDSILGADTEGNKGETGMIK